MNRPLSVRWDPIDETTSPKVLGGVWVVRGSTPPDLVRNGSELKSRYLQLVMAEFVIAARFRLPQAGTGAAGASNSTGADAAPGGSGGGGGGVVAQHVVAELELVRANDGASNGTYMRAHLAVVQRSARSARKARSGDIVAHVDRWYEPRVLSYSLWPAHNAASTAAPVYEWRASDERAGAVIAAVECPPDLDAVPGWLPGRPAPPSMPVDAAPLLTFDSSYYSSSGSDDGDDDGHDDTGSEPGEYVGALLGANATSALAAAAAVSSLPPPPAEESVAHKFAKEIEKRLHAYTPVQPPPPSPPRASLPPHCSEAALPFVAFGDEATQYAAAPATAPPVVAAASANTAAPMGSVGAGGGIVCASAGRAPTGPPLPLPQSSMEMMAMMMMAPPTAPGSAFAHAGAAPIAGPPPPPVAPVQCLLNVASAPSPAMAPPPLKLTEQALRAVNTVRGVLDMPPVGAFYYAWAPTASQLMQLRTEKIIVHTVINYGSDTFEQNGALPCMVPLCAGHAPLHCRWQIVVNATGAESIGAIAAAATGSFGVGGSPAPTTSAVVSQ